MSILEGMRGERLLYKEWKDIGAVYGKISYSDINQICLSADRYIGGWKKREKKIGKWTCWYQKYGKSAMSRFDPLSSRPSVFPTITLLQYYFSGGGISNRQIGRSTSAPAFFCTTLKKLPQTLGSITASATNGLAAK